MNQVIYLFFDSIIMGNNFSGIGYVGLLPIAMFFIIAGIVFLVERLFQKHFFWKTKFLIIIGFICTIIAIILIILGFIT